MTGQNGFPASPFLIAEMSGNHNQSLDRALAIVDAAADAGAHAIKLQTYTADTMTLNLCHGEFVINDTGSLWNGESLYSLYEKAHTPWEWHSPLKERAEKRGLLFFSTPFDATSVEFLEALDVPCYKIASFENIDLPLIRKVAGTRKPIILSTGMATLSELDEAVRTARDAGCTDLTLLKCTSSYPASPEDTNLLTIPHMRDLFNCRVGVSDHTLGIGVALGAVALGAEVIEKHFTLSRADGGVDSAFSLEPPEFRQLAEESARVSAALGAIKYARSEKENASLRFRRSLYIVKDMQAGEVFTEGNLRSIRPGYGLPPKFIGCFMGKPTPHPVKAGTPLTWKSHFVD